MELTIMNIKYFSIRKKFNSFKELCKTITNYYELMEWYKFNNIKWPDDKGKDPNDKIFEWPDYIIKSKIGLCWDHAIFFYYWCKEQNIKPYMVLVQSIYELETEYWCLGHAITFFEINGEFYIFDYTSKKKESQIKGPYKAKDIDELLEKFSIFYKQKTDTITKQEYPLIPYDSDVYYIYTYPGDSLDKIYDRYYNDRSITQNEFMDKYIIPRMRIKYSNYPNFRDKNIKHTDIEQFLHNFKSFFIKIKNKIW